MPRVHLQSNTDSEGLNVALCGWLDVETTRDPKAATCKVCLRRHAGTGKKRKRRVPSVPQAMHDVLASTRSMLDQVETGVMPILTPETWQRRDCACGTCDVCSYFRVLRAAGTLRGLEPTKPIKPRVDAGPRWPNVRAALESYVKHRQDGYSAGGVLGRMQDMMEKGGPESVPPGHTWQGNSATRAAEDVVSVERCLWVAFDRHNDRGIGWASCLHIVFARVVGLERVMVGTDGSRHLVVERVPAAELAREHVVTRNTVAGIVKSGLRRLTIEFAARGLIHHPPPKAGLHDAVDKRRRELITED